MALNTLRKGAARMFGLILMGLLVISFAIWGIEDVFRNYGSQSLVTVGDTEITSQDYTRAQQEVLRVMSADAKRALSLQEAREQGLDRRVLERLVGGAAVDNHAKELGLSISNEALLEAIKNDPSFKDSAGNFSPIALQQAMRNMDMSEQGYIAAEKEHNLRRQLLATIGRTATMPPMFLSAFNDFNNETRTLRYVVVPRSAAGATPAPTDADLKSFYENNKDKYTQPEFRKIGVLAVTPEAVKDQVQITEAEIKEAYEQEKDKLGKAEKRKVQQIPFADKTAADAAYQKIQSGTDFVVVAKENGLSEEDIDLGLLTRADMADAAIAEAAFKLEKDKVSEPVAGELGKFTLLRVTEIEAGKDVTFEEAKKDLESKKLKERAQTAIFDLHDKIEDERAAGAQLSEIAEKFKLKYELFEKVDREGKGPDGKALTLPQQTQLLNAAFASEVGVENDPIDAKDEGLVWFELLGIEPSKLRPFDEVKAKLTEDWRLGADRNIVAKFADGLVKELNSGKTLEDVAKQLNTQVITSEPLKRDGIAMNILPAAIGQAYALPKGTYASAPSGVDEGRIVFQVEKINPAPKIEGPAEQQLKKRLANFIGEDIIGEYFAALEQRYGVTMNRQALARLTGSEAQ